VRAIIDTNVLLAGLLWHGTPHALIERVRDGTLTLIKGATNLVERVAVIAHELASFRDVAELFSELQQRQFSLGTLSKRSHSDFSLVVGTSTIPIYPGDPGGCVFVCGVMLSDRKRADCRKNTRAPQ
jgi:hypothetical protein